MTIVYVIIASFIVMSASLSGIFFIKGGLANWIKKYLNYLVTFSIGVFVMVIFHLIEETVHLSGDWIVIIGWIAFGALLVEILSRLIPKAHHHHTEIEHGHDSGHRHTRIDARRMLMGDAFHNIGDGLILVPAFLVDWRVGLVTTVAIFIHELAQEIGEFFVLKEAGYSDKQAIVRNFLVSGTVLIGVVASLMMVSTESLQVPLLAFSAGGFIYIVLKDLLPHSYQNIKYEGGFFIHIFAGFLGVLLMFAISTLIPHEHHNDFEYEHQNELRG